MPMPRSERFWIVFRPRALDHTLVVIAADHGESLGEHGEQNAWPLRHQSTLRVPLILWAPPAIPASVIEIPARLVGVMPTVLDLVSVAAPAGLDGQASARQITMTIRAPISRRSTPISRGTGRRSTAPSEQPQR
jgi:arylsulfatase A-like enzyme